MTDTSAHQAWPTPGQVQLTAVLVALAVLTAGIVLLGGDRPYRSDAALVLVPPEVAPAETAALLESMERSRSVGTTEQYLKSSDTVRAALGPSVALRVRAVPDTRVLRLQATGLASAVEPALRRVLALRDRVSREAGAPWRLRILQRPTAPVRPERPWWLILPALVAGAALAGAGVRWLGHRLRLRELPGYSTASSPSMPAARWPGTLQ